MERIWAEAMSYIYCIYKQEHISVQLNTRLNGRISVSNRENFYNFAAFPQFFPVHFS